MTGVVIDWQTDDPDGADVLNEIDLILMHQMTPVFISCKNGEVSNEELYKFNTVAERFGGKYAKKVLIATALDPEDLSTRYLLSRADAMNIRVVTDLQRLEPTAAVRRIRNLWKL